MTRRDPTSSTETISLSIPSLPKYLRFVRCMIGEFAGLGGFAPEECDRICLAVGEACSNIIRHSYKEKPDGIISLKCFLHTDRIQISIRDFGEKIDLARIPADSDCLQPGGLGVRMIKRMMDEVDYETTHDVGTEIHMTKYFQRPGSEDES